MRKCSRSPETVCKRRNIMERTSKVLVHRVVPSIELLNSLLLQYFFISSSFHNKFRLCRSFSFFLNLCSGLLLSLLLCHRFLRHYVSQNLPLHYIFSRIYSSLALFLDRHRAELMSTILWYLSASYADVVVVASKNMKDNVLDTDDKKKKRQAASQMQKK